jgi:hypothetical protein
MGKSGGLKKSKFGSFSISIPATAFVFELTVDEDDCALPLPQLYTK